MAFLVLACRLGKICIHRYSRAKSLWIFGPRNLIRKYVIYLTTNQFFEFFVILTILVNCIMLAIHDPPEEAEYVFTGIYTFEMIIKIISRGFILEKNTYLRDPWNWLDFSVVILGYITLAPGMMMNLSGIRTFRVLRALRTISAIEGLKTIVSALLSAMKMLSDVLILTLFFLCIFALIGLQLFNGKLRSRCVSSNITIPVNSSWDQEVRKFTNWYEEIEICGNNTGSMKCPSNFTCLEHVADNPNYGFTSFDNFGWALLTSFQLLTLDYWEDVYFHILSSLGSWYIIYFIIVIFFGTFLVFNLMLAVVTLTYEQVAHQTSESCELYKYLLASGFTYPNSQCSVPKFVFDGPVLDMINTFPKEKLEANLFVITAADDEPSCDDSSDDESVIENRNVDFLNINTIAKNNKISCEVPRSSRISEELYNGDLTQTPIPQLEVESTDSSRNIIRSCRASLQKLITSSKFEVGIVIIILCNTICLALEYHGMSNEMKDILHNINLVAVFIFILEMILKIAALGFREYLRYKWNVFDCVVVIISIVEMILEQTKSAKTTDLNVIRALRLCRVLKIAKSWTMMRSLVSAMARSLNALAYLTIILGIILYMFAVVGMQLFARKYKASVFPSNEVPDWNFNDFGHSFIVIFRVLCGEWIELLYDSMLAAGHSTTLFFIAALIIGNFIVLNLFLALLLESMAEQSAEEEKILREKKNRQLKWANVAKKLSVVTAFMSMKRSSANTAKRVERDKTCPRDNGDINTNDVSKEFIKESAFSNSVGPSHPTSSNNQNKNKTYDRYITCLAKLRKLAAKIQDSKIFQYFIFFVIIISSAVLAFEDIHLPKKPKLEKALEILNVIFCVIFLGEAMIKITALGFIGYIKNGWNVLDFIIVVTSIISILPLPKHVSSLFRTTRSLRAFRPLRAVSRWEGMRVIVNSLVRAIPSIANVLLVCLMVWLIFSILGVQFFGGKFYKCLDSDGNRINADIVPNRTVCEYRNLTWSNSKINFDNVLNGFLLLFEIATFEGMVEIIRDAVDATDIDQQPIKQYNLFANIYFVVFVIIGSFVLLNLFTSVMIDNFYVLKKHINDYGSFTTYLSPSQKIWLFTVKRSLTKRPIRTIQRPTNYHIGRLFDLVCSATFETVVVYLICLDLLVMTLEHYNQPIEIEITLRMTNTILTIIFFHEMILKGIAFRRYFYIHIWNVIDLLIILFSAAVLTLDYFQIKILITLTLFRMARVVRAGRLLRYFNRAKGIRRLFLVIMNSAANAFNMSFLLFIIIFIYSVIGMMNFGHVTRTGSLNDIVNFETFGNSMSMLLRVATCAAWNEVLDALMIEPPVCQTHPESNCPNKLAAVFYITTYVLIASLVIVNMHIAIILENFNDVYQESESGITNEDLEMFYAMWQLYDPSGTQFIPFEQVSVLVANLGPPLAIPLPNKIAIQSMNIPINISKEVHCNNLLQALIKHFYIVREGEDIATTEMKVIIDKKSNSVFPLLKSDIVMTTSAIKYREEKSVIKIQRYFRAFRKKNMDERYNVSKCLAKYLMSSKLNAGVTS